VDSGSAEQFQHGDFPIEARPEPSLHSNEEQRTAAEVKKIVVDTDLGDSQDLLPDTGNLTLQVPDRHLAAAGSSGRRGQRTLVDLAIGGERQCVQELDVRWTIEAGTWARR
jgi:hypothetical protein